MEDQVWPRGHGWPVPGIAHARMLGHLSRAQLFVTLWTAARQAPLSMGFSRQEYWSGLPCPPPGDLPDPGIKPQSLVSPTLASGFFTMSATQEALNTEISPPNPLLSSLFLTKDVRGIAQINATKVFVFFFLTTLNQ